MQICIVYSTFPDNISAQHAIKFLLENKIIACANSQSIQSNYIWDNAIKIESETAVIFKTVISNEVVLKETLVKIHPYSVSCIISYHVDCNESYFQWMNDSLK